MARYDSPAILRTNSPLRSPQKGMCVCGSISPGTTVPPPAEMRGQSSTAGASAAGPNHLIRPRSIQSAAFSMVGMARIASPASGPGGTATSEAMSSIMSDRVWGVFGSAFMLRLW